MASFAILDRECHIEMADAAEFSVDDIVHAEMLGPFFLNIEDVRMAISAVQPFGVL